MKGEPAQAATKAFHDTDELHPNDLMKQGVFDHEVGRRVVAERRLAVEAIRIRQTAKLLDIIACAVDHRCCECRTALARAICVQPQLDDSLCGCSRVEGFHGGDVTHDDSL